MVPFAGQPIYICNTHPICDNLPLLFLLPKASALKQRNSSISMAAPPSVSSNLKNVHLRSAWATQRSGADISSKVKLNWLLGITSPVETPKHYGKSGNPIWHTLPYYDHVLLLNVITQNTGRLTLIFTQQGWAPTHRAHPAPGLQSRWSPGKSTDCKIFLHGLR